MKIADFDFSFVRTYIISEMSGNHNGDINIANETIRAAKRAGAVCIILQTRTADTITFYVQIDMFKAQKGSHWDGQHLHDLYKQAHTPWEWLAELFDCAHNEGITIVSALFDLTGVDLRESLDSPIYMIASFEITDIPLS